MLPHLKSGSIPQNKQKKSLKSSKKARAEIFQNPSEKCQKKQAHKKQKNEIFFLKRAEKNKKVRPKKTYHVFNVLLRHHWVKHFCNVIEKQFMTQRVSRKWMKVKEVAVRNNGKILFANSIGSWTWVKIFDNNPLTYEINLTSIDNNKHDQLEYRLAISWHRTY